MSSIIAVAKMGGCRGARIFEPVPRPDKPDYLYSASGWSGTSDLAAYARSHTEQDLENSRRYNDAISRQIDHEQRAAIKADYDARIADFKRHKEQEQKARESQVELEDDADDHFFGEW